MSQEPDEISKWVQELITRATREQVQGMQRLGNLVQRVSSGELDQSQVRDELSQFIKNESSRYVEDLTRLGLSFQAALVDLNRKYSNRFFDSMLGSAANGQPSNGQPPQPKEIRIHLSGACGEDLVKTFAIENKRDEEETVNFLISEFTDAQSTMAFRPPVQIQPARLYLRPGEERTVTVHLPLLRELFEPGGIYFATIIARGRSDVVLSLQVDVTEPVVQEVAVLVVREQREDTPATGAILLAEPPPRRQPPPARKKAAPRKKVPKKEQIPPDDLTQIKGIGPAYVEKLAASGIRTFADLAAADGSQLAQALGATGLQRLRQQDWQAQARQLSK